MNNAKAINKGKDNWKQRVSDKSAHKYKPTCYNVATLLNETLTGLHLSSGQILIHCPQPCLCSSEAEHKREVFHQNWHFWFVGDQHNKNTTHEQKLKYIFSLMFSFDCLLAHYLLDNYEHLLPDLPKSLSFIIQTDLITCWILVYCY